MLQPISSLTQEQQIHALLARPQWVAVCQDTGAYLLESHGRSKWGNGTRYFLILPKVNPGKLFDYGQWENKDRKIFRAFTLAAAIEEANKKLEKMLAKRQD